MITRVIERAQQECEAGFPVWRQIPVRLQLALFASDNVGNQGNAGEEDAELLLFNPSSERGFAPASSLQTDLPTARLSRSTLLQILSAKRCAQQAFLDGALRITGDLAAALHFTRLFIELARIADELAREQPVS